MWTSVRIRLETFEKLKQLKEKHNTTFDEVISMLLKEHEALERVRKMKKLMEFSETWWKLNKMYREIMEDEELRAIIG